MLSAALLSFRGWDMLENCETSWRAFLLSDSAAITEQDIVKASEMASCNVMSSSTAPTSFQTAPKQQLSYFVSHTRYRYSKISSATRSEPERFKDALEETRWNKSEAAKLLRCSRMTVYRKVVQYDLRPTEATELTSPSLVG